MTFGEWIRQRRKAEKLTLDDVGKIVGTGKSNLSKLERGTQKEINISRVRPLCKALNISADELLDAWDRYGKS